MVRAQEGLSQSYEKLLEGRIPEVLTDVQEVLPLGPEIVNFGGKTLQSLRSKIKVSGMQLLKTYIEYQLGRDENVFIVIDGRTQMGKSTTAIQLALLLERYNLEHVVFTIDELRKLISSNPPEGTLIIYDDPQTEFNSQDWQQRKVKELTRVAQIMGNHHYVMIMTTPNLGSLPGQIQWLVTIYLQGDDTRKAFFRAKRPTRRKNVTMKNKDIYYGYLPVMIAGTRKKVKLKSIRSERLPRSVYEPYDNKKRAAHERFYSTESEEPEKRVPTQGQIAALERAREAKAKKRKKNLSNKDDNIEFETE